MTPEIVIQLMRQCLITALSLATPILLIGLAIGVVVNIIQVATSIQDSAFSAVPRLAAVVIGVLVLAPWMLRQLVSYAFLLFSNLSPYAR